MLPRPRKSIHNTPADLKSVFLVVVFSLGLQADLEPFFCRCFCFLFGVFRFPFSRIFVFPLGIDFSGEEPLELQLRVPGLLVDGGGGGGAGAGLHGAAHHRGLHFGPGAAVAELLPPDLHRAPGQAGDAAIFAASCGGLSGGGVERGRDEVDGMEKRWASGG